MRELTPFRHLFDILRNETIGFDQVLRDVSDANSTVFRNEQYPKYNIAEKADGTHVIEVAAAGFSKEDIDVSLEESSLIIRAKSTKEEDSTTRYHKKGIASREFRLSIPIAPGSEVKDANFENGIVRVEVQGVQKRDTKKIPLR